VIHIYEADWNLLLKFFVSYKLTHTACHEKSVSPEQAGGRLGRSANDMATKTVLTHEICRLQRLSGAIVYNDAKACFDRIIENVSNLTCLREGMAPEIALLHAQTLQTMRYYIQTQTGPSPKFNGHLQPDPFLGSGQGAGDSMALWGFLSDAIIRAYNKVVQTDIIQSPTSKTYIHENIQAFVDDSHSIMIQAPTNETPLHTIIQHNMQQWEALLHTVGGKLEISKCQFIRFGHTSCNTQNQHTDPPITILDHDSGTTISPAEIVHSTPYKLLGVHMAFDGNTKSQAASLHQKCSKLAIAFNRCQLSTIDTIQGYRSIFLPGVRYGMSVTNIPPKQIIKAQQMITSIILPKMGYN
jgi:hypothetical protein